MRSRIVGRRKVPAKNLKPHPLNWRTHPDHQRAAVTALYEEVGEVRSLTAYVADADKPLGEQAPLTLIDGHGRRDWLPEEILEVEVLDLTDEEARKVLLSLDATAALAGRDDEALAELRRTTQADAAALEALWESLAAADEDTAELLDKAKDDEADAPEQFLILITCRSERHQGELLAQLQKKGLKCKPLMS